MIRYDMQEDTRQKLETRAERSANRWAWGGIVAMGLQFGVLARLTWCVSLHLLIDYIKIYMLPLFLTPKFK